MCPHCKIRLLVARRDARTCGSPDCTRAESRRRRRASYYARERAERTCICGVCGAHFTWIGPRRSLCDACRQIGKSIAVVQIRIGLERYICAGCAAEFTRKPTKGQRPRWCPDCKQGRGWRRANRDSINARWHKRRVLLEGGEIEDFTPVEIFERDRWRCGICRKPVKKDLAHPHPGAASIDHIVPVVEGGGHTRANVRLTHLRCNLSRGPRGGGEQLVLIG